MQESCTADAWLDHCSCTTHARLPHCWCIIRALLSPYIIKISSESSKSHKEDFRPNRKLHFLLRCRAENFFFPRLYFGDWRHETWFRNRNCNNGGMTDSPDFFRIWLFFYLPGKQRYLKRVQKNVAVVFFWTRCHNLVRSASLPCFVLFTVTLIVERFAAYLNLTLRSNGLNPGS